jgi:hypothetical protein
MGISYYIYPGLSIGLISFIESQIPIIFGVTLAETMVRCRERRLVIPRQAYLTAMCRFCGYTEHGFAKILFERFRFSYDHATINHAKNVIEDVYLPRKVVDNKDKIYAEMVNQFWMSVQNEYQKNKVINDENYRSSRASK